MKIYYVSMASPLKSDFFGNEYVDDAVPSGLWLWEFVTGGLRTPAI